MNLITFAEVAASSEVELIILESDPDVAKVIALPFERNGYRITIVSQAFQSGPMPPFDGKRAFFVVNSDCLDDSGKERMANMGRHRVIFTSSSDASEIVQTYGLPCFQKPFSPWDLYRTVDDMLTTGESPSARRMMAKRSEEVVERLRHSPAQSLRRLATALEICRQCQRRCPGLPHCADVQSALNCISDGGEE